MIRISEEDELHSKKLEREVLRWKIYMGVNRETFLIEKEGIVCEIWPKVKAAEHTQEVLESIESLGL